MTDEDKTFDAEYVSDLRSEAAKYRTRARDLESQLDGYSKLEAEISKVRVENELMRRGIPAEPDWVPLKEGQSPKEAVEAFLEKHPQLAVGETSQDNGKEPQVKKTPGTMPRDGQSGSSPTKVSSGAFQGRSLDEIEKDPQARQTLRDHYRDLLRQSSNIGD